MDSRSPWQPHSLRPFSQHQGTCRDLHLLTGGRVGRRPSELVRLWGHGAGTAFFRAIMGSRERTVP